MKDNCVGDRAPPPRLLRRPKDFERERELPHSERGRGKRGGWPGGSNLKKGMGGGEGGFWGLVAEDG